jgi:hypothetical protein
VTLNVVKNVLKASSQAGQTKQGDGFKKVRSRKRNSTGEEARTSKKATLPTSAVKVATNNFFAPPSGQPTWTLMPLSPSPNQQRQQLQENRAGRPQKILTSAAKLIQLQKQLKGVAKQSLEFCNTRNGVRGVTKDMVDYQAVKSFFDNNSLAYYTFYPKAEKPIKAVIHHLPNNTPAEDIADGLADLGFEVISVKQMSTARRSPDGSKPITLPLFLVTLPRTTKSLELCLCHISIKVEEYNSQNTLPQRYNCQKFGHAWANCKQPPRCLWCGGGHLHKDCLEKGDAS